MALTKGQKETKGAREIIAALEERLGEIGERKITIPLIYEAENLTRCIKDLKQRYA